MNSILMNFLSVGGGCWCCSNRTSFHSGNWINEYVNVLVIVNVVVSDELIALVLIILVLAIGVVECNDSTLPLVVIVASLIISEVFGLLLVPVTFSEVIEVLSIVVISLVFSLAVDDSVTVLTSPFRLDSVDGEEVVLEVLETLSDT